MINEFINSKDSQNVKKFSSFYLVQNLKDLISKIKSKDAKIKINFITKTPKK